MNYLSHSALFRLPAYNTYLFNIYLLKIKKKRRKTIETCSKLTINKPEQRPPVPESRFRTDK